LNNFMNN